MNSSKHLIKSWSDLLVLLVSSAWLRAVRWTCAAHVRLVCYCATWGERENKYQIWMRDKEERESQ